MILGYGIIAVPTGIVTVEFGQQGKAAASKDDPSYVHINTQACTACSAEGHRDDARFCHKCGAEL